MECEWSNVVVDGDDLNHLILWNLKVDLPLNEESKHALKSFKINRSKIPFLMEMLEDIFGSAPTNDRLHVVVMPGESSVSIHVAIISSILISVSICS